MIEYRILIYVNNDKIMQRLCGLARQIGMSPTPCVNATQARSAMAAHFMEIAIIDLELEPITLPPSTRRIALGKADDTTQEKLLFYSPEGIVADPEHDPGILFNLIKVSGIIPTAQTLPCHLIEMITIIQEEFFRIRSLLKAPSTHFSFLRSVEEYCHFYCTFSKTPDELTAQEVKEYTPIFMSSGRGHLLCKFRPQCTLHKLAEHLQETRPETASPSPASIFLCPGGQNEQTSLTATLKETRAQCRVWSETLLESRRELCQKSCHTLDPQGLRGNLIKHNCCEYGCVLDNYFAMNPNKKHLKPTRTLIYENVASDAKILDFICRDFNMEPFFATNAQEAQALIGKTTFDYAIINPELETIALPSVIKTIIVDAPSLALIARILTYRPVSVISKPFTAPELSAGITKALRVPSPQTSQMATINNLSMGLEYFETALNNWQTLPNNRLNFENSTRYYCENRCPMAKTKAAIKDNEFTHYQPLNQFAKRGALYCKIRKVCRLWKFLEHLKTQHGPELMAAPTDILNTPRQRSKEESLSDFITASMGAYLKHAEKLNTIRQGFCTGVCDKHKKDMDIQKGDFIFSSFREVLAQNYYLYCAEHSCALMSFFEYFKRQAT